MSQKTLMSRIGRWFRRGSRPNGDLPLDGPDDSTALDRVETSRNRFPWPGTRNAEVIAAVQQSVQGLSELMGSIRDNMERQAQRQEELLHYLSGLPEALQSLPEATRAQGEAFRTIAKQIDQQNNQQARLADILAKFSDASAGQKQILDSLNNRVETISETEAAITDNLRSVGSAMQSVSRQTESSAGVLQQMRDNLSTRDGQLEKILHKHNIRFTTIATFAVVMSVAVLAALGIVVYILLTRR